MMDRRSAIARLLDAAPVATGVPRLPACAADFVWPEPETIAASARRYSRTTPEMYESLMRHMAEA